MVLNVLTSNAMEVVYLGGGYHPNSWQFAVEAAYRLKFCHLVDFGLDVLTKYEKLSNNTFDGLDDFAITCLLLTQTIGIKLHG